ncbi:MBL fold metallo-hydrolase [Streptomyces lichenis]|uniref:MBL fold metallo-hydrolase n=1 Tax=Streptomyces lichenis TaxID=2306967 RepID=A0ABT0IGW0_9ACTN|nr:MBL fold metallo-hydrolase [Streptomyces lichenis]MCK8680568.1 MBL fold metallo-hydrolase [Streptomyces lichenis]
MGGQAVGGSGAAWAVGDVVVHRVDELLLAEGTGAWLLPGATPEVVGREEWLRPDFADAEGVLRLASHSFAFEVGGVKVVVDTGIGNGKERANPAWHGLRTDYLERLAAVGFAPESVDVVVLTHLHADHVGWNTTITEEGWVPTFPNARYVVSRVEREFWAGYAMDEARRQMFRDSVEPVERAGLMDAVEVGAQGRELVPGVRLVPTPGHTPGHVAVRVDGDGGAGAVITGDCVHHPVQLVRPGIGSCVDIDPEAAEETRRALLGELAGTGTLLLGTHFAPPTGGLVVREGEGYRLVAGER